MFMKLLTVCGGTKFFCCHQGEERIKATFCMNTVTSHQASPLCAPVKSFSRPKLSFLRCVPPIATQEDCNKEGTTTMMNDVLLSFHHFSLMPPAPNSVKQGELTNCPKRKKQQGESRGNEKGREVSATKVAPLFIDWYR